MPSYTPPLRDMQFVLHELLNVVDELKMLPAHADIDADTINAVLEEGGKFCAEVIAPLNLSGDKEGCQLDRDTHEVRTPSGFKEGLQDLRRRRLACAELRPGLWRPRPAVHGQPVLLRDAEQRQPELDHVPGSEPWRLRMPARPWH